MLILSKIKFQLEQNQKNINAAESALFLLIRTHKPSKLYAADEDKKSEDYLNLEQEEIIQNIFWFDELCNQIENYDENDIGIEYLRPNMYFFPKFAKYLRSILYTLPLWGAIMVDIFKSPNINVSSANQESSFRYLKNNLFKFIKRQRADTFLVSHINDLIGSTNVATANLNTYRLAQMKTNKNDPETIKGIYIHLNMNILYN